MKGDVPWHCLGTHLGRPTWSVRAGLTGLPGLSNSADLHSFPHEGLGVQCVNFLGFICVHPLCHGKIAIHGNVA